MKRYQIFLLLGILTLIVIQFLKLHRYSLDDFSSLTLDKKYLECHITKSNLSNSYKLNSVSTKKNDTLLIFEYNNKYGIVFFNFEFNFFVDSIQESKDSNIGLKDIFRGTITKTELANGKDMYYNLLSDTATSYKFILPSKENILYMATDTSCGNCYLIKSKNFYFEASSNIIYFDYKDKECETEITLTRKRKRTYLVLLYPLDDSKLDIKSEDILNLSSGCL